MSSGLLNASGLTTPKVITEEIILRGKPISDASNGGGEVYNPGIYILEANFITIKDESGNPTGQYSWYRKWSDGWVEQGGNFIWDGTTTSPKTYVVTLLEPLRDINYQVFASMENYTATGYYPWINNKTTTSFELYVSGTAGTKSDVTWKANGYKS